MHGCVRSRAHWNNTVNWARISAAARLLLSGVHRFFLASGVVVFTGGNGQRLFLRLWSPCYVCGVENTWWKVCSGIQPGRTGHLPLTTLCFLFSPFLLFPNLCVMCVEWKQRMDIIWEILIILQANFIVCISGESWASLVSSRQVHEIKRRGFCYIHGLRFGFVWRDPQETVLRTRGGRWRENCKIYSSVCVCVARNIPVVVIFGYWVWSCVCVCACEPPQERHSSLQNWIPRLLTRAWHSFSIEQRSGHKRGWFFYVSFPRTRRQHPSLLVSSLSLWSLSGLPDNSDRVIIKWSSCAHRWAHGALRRYERMRRCAWLCVLKGPCVPRREKQSLYSLYCVLYLFEITLDSSSACLNYSLIEFFFWKMWQN